MASSRTERQFLEAKSAVQSGDIHRARILLSELVKTDKHNPDIWVWLSAVLDTQKERRFCLEQALKLDPNHAAARRAMAALGEAEYRKEMHVPFRAQRRNWERDLGLLPLSPAQQMAKAGLWRPLFYTLIALAVVGAITLTALGIYQLTRPRMGRFGVLMTSTPSTTATEPAHEYAFFNLDLLNKQTPLADLLARTATPHPTRTPYVVLGYLREENRSIISAYARQDWDAMIQHLQTLIRLEPDAADAHYYLGLAHQNKGEYEAALAAYQASLAINPEYPPALMGQALILHETQQASWEDTFAELERILALDEQMPDIYLAMTDLLLEQSRSTEAITLLRQAETVLPDDVEVHLRFARAYMQQRSPREALEHVLNAQKRDGTRLEVYELLAEVYFELGEFEKALEPLSIAAIYAGDENPAWWTKLGYCLMELGEEERAQEALERALTLGAADFDTLYAQAIYLMGKELPEEAMEFMQKAYDLQPRAFASNMGIAQVYKHMNDCNRTMYYFNRALVYATNESEQAEVYYHRALCHLELGSTTSAYRDFLELSKLPEEAMPAEWYQRALEGIQIGGTATPSPQNTPINSPTHTRTPDAARNVTATRTSTSTRTPTRTPTPTRTRTPSQ